MSIQKLASQCVMCGMCLPVCPTYQRTLHEAESPRGRIALANALATGALPLTESLETFLDHCLHCRACEAICPAEVSFGELMDEAKALIQILGRATVGRNSVSVLRRMSFISSGAIRMRMLLRPTKAIDIFTQNKTAQWLAAWLAWMCGHAQRPIRFAPKYSPTGNKRGCVALFTGCMSSIFERNTLLAAIQVLTKLGYEVHLPPDQTCCGAVYRHSGQPKKAAILENQNRTAFLRPEYDAVITCASGCAVSFEPPSLTLPHKGGGDKKLKDISEFLSEIAWGEGVVLKPFPHSVAVHDPCSLRFAKKHLYPYQVLQKIPEINLFEMPENSMCCGAGGTHFLKYPDISETFIQKKLALLTAAPNFIVTSNITCRLQLTRGLSRHPQLKSTPVLHPIELLARVMSSQASF